MQIVFFHILAIKHKTWFKFHKQAIFDIMRCFKCYLVVLILLLFYACRHNQQNNCIDLTQISPTSVFEIFSEVKLVKLEPTPGNLIGIISKVIYDNGRYYILDARTMEILCFDSDGRFSFKISALGKGPGEYNNVSDFSIDRINGKIVLLDAPMQRLLFFDLEGRFLDERSVVNEQVMGFNRVVFLSDTVLLLSSISNEQLVFFSLKENRVIKKDFHQEVFLQAFAPTNNVYQFDGYTYALPALSQQVISVTETEPHSHYYWCFGKHDNTDKQIDILRKEIEKRTSPYDFFYYAHEAVGKGNFLHQHIWKVFETSRFSIALVEFDNNWRHVVIDKSTGEIRVFNHFEEQVSLSHVSIQEDLVIAYDSGVKDRIKARGAKEWQHRIVDGFNPDILSESDRQTIANHNPMTDNPFLVVYTFRE